MLSRLRDIDFYRKIPRELTETSSYGSILSIVALVFMVVVFLLELSSFLSVTYMTAVTTDSMNKDTLLQINFNITMLDLPCDYTVIDVVDVLGRRDYNLSKNILKWQVDAAGIRRSYEGKNTEQADLMHETIHDTRSLTENGIHAVPIEQDNFDAWLGGHKYTFVNFYAPWCVWCQRLEPVWEAFAERIEEEQLPISIVKVDCVANSELCMTNRVQAFPTLKFFKEKTLQSPDYRTDRTIDAFMTFCNEKLAADHYISNLDPKEREEHEVMRRLANEKNEEHPGCLVTGSLLVNRVPGNFHIEARSKHHNLNPVMSNMSHVVNHLSFGLPLNKKVTKLLSRVNKDYFSIESTHSMDSKIYANRKLHQAFHHYIKMITTYADLGGSYSGKNKILSYQMVQASQIMQYEDDDIPEARFTYDLSPMSVTISKKGKAWYEFITSMCALIGGTFTVAGLLTSFFTTIFKAKRI